MPKHILRKRHGFGNIAMSCRYLSHFRVVEHVVPGSFVRTYPGAIEPGAETNVRLATKQYIPLKEAGCTQQQTAVTIIGGHANGFPKELYEPLWDDLYEDLASRGCSIRGIWIADNAHQGQSGILNQNVLGNDPNWWDHARDLLYLINRKQAQMSSPIVGIGHSMGASILVALSLLHPSLFQSLILIDPVIQTENPSKSFAPASTHRRDRWPSRQAAVESFAKSKFYQSWDRRVLEKWLDYGLREDNLAGDHRNCCDFDQGQVGFSRDAALHDPITEPEILENDTKDRSTTLTTTKAQEVFHYLRPLYKGRSASDLLAKQLYPDVNMPDIEPNYGFYRPEPAEIFRCLPNLRPSALYIFGKNSPFSQPDLLEKKRQYTGTGVGGSGGAEKGFVKDIHLDTGHLVPFEDCSGCAEASAGWIDHVAREWHSMNQEWITLWKQTKHKRSVDDEWLRCMPKAVKSASRSNEE